ncbi:MAG: trypsin-like peptidase domain-containing protein [Mariniblastus sp.]|nr:trypsin-like peptidase domain-containing protein [Mariniblastus sp.]
MIVNRMQVLPQVGKCFPSTLAFSWFVLAAFAAQGQQAVQEIVPAPIVSYEEMELILAAEQKRIAVIDKVVGTVVAVYGESRQGGGSGVIIDSSGIALTNHHVIMGAGVSGWAGLADGQLYHWKLIGTDPGGDVAIIQLEGQTKFPFASLGDSDQVQVGDWALAMGNPFLLSENQKPTVTLGIVSGVKRYQPGAGKNQLIYGNCIQVDSSINPGNSGGPLFNMKGQVIGINGRGSFQDRGRVNVGLGYAISANQIKNFIPELLATKLVEHGTLDANFTDREGRVICENLYQNTPLYEAGMRPGDELVSFEGVAIETANQFTNLLCTLPEDWPARLTFRDAQGQLQTFHTRLFGLPYVKPQGRSASRPSEAPSPEEEQQRKQQEAMFHLLAATPGTIRDEDINRAYVSDLLKRWQGASSSKEGQDFAALRVVAEILEAGGEHVGRQQIWFAADFRKFRIEQSLQGEQQTLMFDGRDFYQVLPGGEERLSVNQASRNPMILSAMGIASANSIDIARPFFSAATTRLDGADSSQRRNAYRFRASLDLEGDFFFWLSMYDLRGKPNVELLKLSADKNCEIETGGVIFSRWTKENGVRIPSQRTWVRNLAESPVLEFQTREVEEVLEEIPTGFWGTSFEMDQR